MRLSASISLATLLPAIVSADAYWILSGNKNEDVPEHGPLNVPAGSQLVNLTIGSNGEQVVTYQSTGLQNDQIVQAIVMLHGRLRNGDAYWTIANDVLQSALRDNYQGANPNTLIISPEFFSTIRNSGEYTDDQMAWEDVNAWEFLASADHPKGTNVSAADVYDSFLSMLSNKLVYPNLTNVTLVGHGGGGQFMARYAALGEDPPSGISVRYVVGDPSSNLYFTEDRPNGIDAGGATKGNCPLYNTYRYGFEDIANSTVGAPGPKHAFGRITSRDVVWIVGLNDTAADGDQTCAAFLLGGQARKERNLIYWRYINTLANTGADLSAYPGSFDSVPDWSRFLVAPFQPRIVTVANATHDAAEVFGGEQGREVLFRSTFPTGYHP